MDVVSRLPPSVCFQVEKIIGVSVAAGNVRNYHVQWAPTWVSGLHLVGCDEMIAAFFNQMNDNNSNSNGKTSNNDNSNNNNNNNKSSRIINNSSDRLERNICSDTSLYSETDSLNNGVSTVTGPLEGIASSSISSNQVYDTSNSKVTECTELTEQDEVHPVIKIEDEDQLFIPPEDAQSFPRTTSESENNLYERTISGMVGDDQSTFSPQQFDNFEHGISCEFEDETDCNDQFQNELENPLCTIVLKKPDITSGNIHRPLPRFPNDNSFGVSNDNYEHVKKKQKRRSEAGNADSYIRSRLSSDFTVEELRKGGYVVGDAPFERRQWRGKERIVVALDRDKLDSIWNDVISLFPDDVQTSQFQSIVNDKCRHARSYAAEKARSENKKAGGSSDTSS